MDAIQAVSVNHNTSRYMELMLRSLFSRHPRMDLSVTVLDNDSQDEKGELEAYARSRGIPVLPSGFGPKTECNSHGEILTRFVLQHPECAYYLFLDPDVCFVHDDTLDSMVEELERDKNAFGIGPRWSWDGTTEIPERVGVHTRTYVYTERLHPCCALVKNTGVFRRVVEEVGLSAAKLRLAGGEMFLDTFKLMTRVMRTHGLGHIISSKKVIHFGCVSYPVDFITEEDERGRIQHRESRLKELREAGSPKITGRRAGSA